MIRKCTECGDLFNGVNGYYTTNEGWLGCSDNCATADGQSQYEEGHEGDDDYLNYFWTEDEDEAELLESVEELLDLVNSLRSQFEVFEGTRRGNQLDEAVSEVGDKLLQIAYGELFHRKRKIDNAF